MKTHDNVITLCRKCDRKGYVAVTDENRAKLQAHCRCFFPPDVIAVCPSALCSTINAEEEIELARQRQEKRSRYVNSEKPKRKKQNRTSNEKDLFTQMYRK